ncbi:MAG: PAS domain-containing sensor histidine kinase [Chrysiogenales bacterium]|nr:MAG: PAS domain-containing sensor histidine kinase [Chrysiogenales bacterium]
MVSLVTGTSINIIIAIVIVTILAYMISLITDRSLRAAEEELARNRDLTVELEHQVEQLEATNEEMESMNEELNHTYTELLESNKNLRIFKNFAEASGQGLAMFRPSGTLLYVNRALCILLGREGPGEMAGEDFLACYPGEWKTRLTGEIFPSVTTEGQWIGELPLSARDGTQIPTIQNLFLMSDETGRELCVAAVITDLTERKRMEAHLLHADRVKAIGKLAGGIAHDFNNILTAIMGFGELLLGDLPPGDRLREYAEEILRAGRMSADIVHQLCAFGKGQVMNLAPFDINHEITSLRAILLRYMNEGMELLLDLDPDPPIVFADATQIEQVIINLVINARDSMPVGGRITIRTRHSFMNASGVPGISEEDPRPAAAISFEDTGSGISEELLPRIFEPFFTTKENKEGSGLGLSVVHGIIEQHGGRITVTSIPEGGSTFTAYLPIAKEEPVTPDSAKVEPDRLRGSGERILVVEDREKVRAFASILLREFGYIVFEAENGDRASKVFDDEKGAIDLLFTDIVMPGGSGYDLIDTLTAKKKDLRVLVCSGYAEVESPRRRTFPFLQKPYSVVDLLRAVGEVLGKG